MAQETVTPGKSDPSKMTQSWRVGDVLITRTVEFSTNFALERPWLGTRFIDESGKMRGAVQSFVLELKGKIIVVDPGLGNDKERKVPLFHKLHTSFSRRWSRLDTLRTRLIWWCVRIYIPIMLGGLLGWSMINGYRLSRTLDISSVRSNGIIGSSTCFQ